MIDIGANLASASFATDLDAVLQRAKAAGLEAIIVTGSDFASNQQAEQLAVAETGFLYCTAGLHPHHASAWSAEVEAQIQSLSQAPHCVAIGETGLDYNRNFSSPAEQRRAFAAHLELAEQSDKPLFLHQRDAHEDFLAMLREHPKLCQRAVVHCFTDTTEALESYLELGAMIGITGWLCDKKRGAALRETVKRIPLQRLMIESDAPYLMPDRDRIKHSMAQRNRNEPHTLGLVVTQLAISMGCTEEEVVAASSANARRFFGLG